MRSFVWSILNIERIIWISSAGTFECKDKCLIALFQLSLQCMTKRDEKLIILIRWTAKDWDQCLISIFATQEFWFKVLEGWFCYSAQDVFLKMLINDVGKKWDKITVAPNHEFKKPELGTFVLDTHNPDGLISISTAGTFELRINA